MSKWQCGEVGFQTANDGCVRRMGDDLHGTPGADLGGRSGVVIVKVREHQTVEISGDEADLPERSLDHWSRGYCTGVDERDRVAVVP